MGLLRVLIVFFGVLLPLFSQDKYDVLVLHSYHKNYQWTDNIQEGINRKLLASKNNLYVEYMDTKRFSSKEHIINFQHYLEEKYATKHFDVVIAADNYAYNFLRDNRERLFRGIPLFFCGVNGFEPSQIQGIEDITGVSEIVDIDTNIKLITKLHPNVNKIVFITDMTLTGEKVKEDFVNAMRTFKKPIEQVILQNISMKALEKKLASLDKNAIVLLSFFFRDKADEYFSTEQFTMRISNASSVPVYGLWGFSFGHGIVGGYLVNGISQGERVGDQVTTYLRGTKIADIPVLTKNSNGYMFDNQQLMRFGMDKVQLPANSHVINYHKTLFQKYYYELSILFVFIGVLVIFIIVLGISVAKQKSTENKLKKSRKELAKIINTVPHRIFVKDSEGNFLLVNQATADGYGLSVEEVVGKNMRTLAPNGTQVEHFLKDDKEVLKMQHSKIIFGETFTDTKGETHVLNTYKVPFTFNEVPAVLGVCVDVSDIHKAEEKLRTKEMMFRAIFDNTFQLIGILDKEGKIIQANQTSLDFAGLSLEDVAGKYFWETPWWDHASQTQNELKEAIHNIHDGSMVRLRTEHIDKNGIIHDIDFSLKQVTFEDGTQYLIPEGRDITPLRKAERELEKLNDELEYKVIERTKELEDSLHQLHETQHQLVQHEKMASLGNLVAGVAHEINTPIGLGITGVTHLMEEVKKIQLAYEDETLEEQHFQDFLKNCADVTRVIYNNLTRSSELIRSFKQISVDQVSEAKREFDVKEYTYEVLVSLNNKLKKRKIDVTVECEKRILLHSYPGIYAQILTNLLLNSLIHAYEYEDEGHIVIRLKEMDDSFIFEYEDDGRGIEEEHLSKIFDPFFTTARDEGGTGLGLNIVYNLVTSKIGGTINCNSERGKGTTFIIIIPL